METKTQAPSFTVSLRGYDREEVDEYLDSLAEALGQVEEAEEHSRRLQSHVAKCNARIRELEDRIRSDTPKSGAALGERIGLLLTAAEETAADTVSQAETNAARIVAAAEARAAEAEELMRNATCRADEQARRIETVARGEAAEIVAEAEARAAARTRQIEQWAEQVISHTRAEEARLYLEQQNAREAATAALASLAEQRAAAASTLIDLREAIGRAVGLAELTDEKPVEAGAETVGTQAARPDAGSSLTAHVVAEAPPGELLAVEYPGGAADMPTGEQLETKLDNWISGGTGTGS